MIGLAVTAAALLPQQPRVTTIQLPEGASIARAFLQDVDLDGQLDLVLSCRRAGKRSVQVYARGSSGKAFAATPSRRLELDGSVVAFAFCDCDPRAGRELVLFTSTTAAVVLPARDEEPDYRQLFRHPLVWPAAAPEQAMPLPDATADLDGDGRDDLMLPRPDGWSAWFQGDEGFEVQELELPEWRDEVRDAVSGRGAGGGLRFRFAAGRPTRGQTVLVSTSARTPPCALVDLDGDGRRDLVAQRNGVVHVGEWDAPRQLTTTQRPLPLPEDRLKLLDPSFDVQWPDIDGDGRPDLLLTTSTNRDDEVEARVDVFITQPDGSWPDRRDMRLRMQPMAAPPRLVDADGDGRDDLACVTLRTAAISELTGGEGASLDAQLTIYAGDGDGFAKKPILNVAVKLGSSRATRQPLVFVRSGRRGVPGDVLLRTSDQLERRLLARSSGGLRLAAPDRSVRVSGSSRVLVADEDGDDVLVIDGAEVRHVRFRR